jgi:NIMA-interacting peptidyl-prolyl cis-trans isomerase 1
MNTPQVKDPIRCVHILVKHTGSRNPVSRRTKQDITISKEQAFEKINKIKNMVTTSNFLQIAQQESDCGSFEEGGDLGIFGRGDMQAPFEKAAYELPVNSISGIVDTDSGLHLIMRLQIPQQIRCSHILCKHNQSRNPLSRRTDKPVTISKADATQELKNIKKTLNASNFAEIASTRSDCGSFKKGGDLGFFGLGEMQKPFEEIAFKLSPGEISDLVETDSGVHIIMRVE